MRVEKRLVLHIDDDPLVCSMVAAQLSRRGYEVVSCTDPGKAMDYIVTAKYRVVLLDIVMPGCSGMDLLRQIKRTDGSILVIMVTGLVEMMTVLDALRNGAEACLFKPIADFEPLVECVGDAFRKLDRWWAALEELSQLRKAAETSGAQKVTQA